MAESMSGLARSHRCTEVSNKLIGTEVTVMGWVQKRRNLGSLIFVDLRDRSGILQLVFDQEVFDIDTDNEQNRSGNPVKFCHCVDTHRTVDNLCRSEQENDNPEI